MKKYKYRVEERFGYSLKELQVYLDTMDDLGYEFVSLCRSGGFFSKSRIIVFRRADQRGTTGRTKPGRSR